MITAEQAQQFHEQGYLAVRGVVDTEQLERLRDAVNSLQERSRSVGPEGDEVFDVAPGHGPDSPRVNRINHPVMVDELFARLAISDRVLDAVSALIGEDIKFHHSKLNMKTSGGTEIGWHQDFAFFPHTNSDLIACGIALDDADRSNGCLLVVPGTHREGMLNHFDGRGEFVGKISDPTEAFDRDAVPVELKAGDMSVHHCKVVHGSLQNDSERSRRLFICQYAASDAIPLDHRPPVNEFSDKVLRGGPATHARLEGPQTLALRGSVCPDSSIFKRQAVGSRATR